MSYRIAELVANGEVPFEGGGAFSLPIKKLELSEDAYPKLAAWLKSLPEIKRLMVVSDGNTEVAAAALKAILAAENIVADELILPGTPRPERALAISLASEHAAVDLWVAVGGGTIGDLVKYISHLTNRPYVMVPTAPSMNGYFSATASLLEGGHKQSYPAHLPIALFGDLKVLAAAPTRLIRSGVGDLLCRSTAQADWLLSHHLLGTPYNKLPFEMVAGLESKLFSNAPMLIKENTHATRDLMELLLLSGLGMTICGGSYPASQGEHLIAHTMEMRYGEALNLSFHGEQIGVTTLVMAQLQEQLLEKSEAKFSMDKIPHEYQQVMHNKGLTEAKIEHINQMLALRWNEIRAEIKKITVPYAKLAATLESIAAPRTPEALGWRDDWFAEAMRVAPYYRDRFTFLDMAALIKN